MKIAEALEVSLDYLVGKEDLQLEQDIIKKILSMQKLPEQDREHILFT
ncbi:hypothetical protein [Halocola ammonii]